MIRAAELEEIEVFGGNTSVSIATASTWCLKENGHKPHMCEDFLKYWSNINEKVMTIS